MIVMVVVMVGVVKDIVVGVSMFSFVKIYRHGVRHCACDEQRSRLIGNWVQLTGSGVRTQEEVTRSFIVTM